MNIITQKMIDELEGKYGSSFTDFISGKTRDLEKEYLANRNKNWLLDCFAKIDINDDITTKIFLNLKTFSSLFRSMGEEFDPETDRKNLAAGKYGAIWTADIMIDKTLKDDVLRFESEKGQILTETLPKVV